MKSKFLAAALSAVLAFSSVAPQAVLAQSPAEYQETHELVIGLPYAFKTLDPARGGALRVELSLLAAIYSPLTRVDGDGNLQGVVAEKWEQTSDLTWRFTLRDDVTFSDGTPLTAETVKWNLDRYLTIDQPSWIVASVRHISEVSVAAPNVVDVTLTHSDMQLPRRMAALFLLDPTWVANNDPKVEAMGSGPYTLVDYNPEAGATLLRNDSYFGEPPAFKNVRYRVVTDAAARVNGLKAGEIDAAALIDPLDLKQLEENGNLVTGIVPANRVQVLRINTLVEPLADLRVRQALNYAIDKEAITKALFGGKVEPSRDQAITNLYDGYNAEMEAWPYDPERARALLAEAGYPNGLDLEMVFGKGTYVGAEQAAQIVAAQLAEVGIRAKLEIIPAALHAQRLASDEQAGLSWDAKADAAGVAADTLAYFGSGFMHTRGPIDPAFDEALAAAQSATSKEAEIAAVQAATKAAADSAQMVFLWDLPQTFAYNKQVQWNVRSDDWTLATDFVAAP